MNDLSRDATGDDSAEDAVGHLGSVAHVSRRDDRFRAQAGGSSNLPRQSEGREHA
jgi:hypothetical protein